MKEFLIIFNIIYLQSLLHLRIRNIYIKIYLINSNEICTLIGVNCKILGRLGKGQSFSPRPRPISFTHHIMLKKICPLHFIKMSHILTNRNGLNVIWKVENHYMRYIGARQKSGLIARTNEIIQVYFETCSHAIL